MIVKNEDVDVQLVSTRPGLTDIIVTHKPTKTTLRKSAVPETLVYREKELLITDLKVKVYESGN